MIHIAQVQKVVDQRTALEIDRLDVPAGEIAAVIGPAGSGRETLMPLLIGKEQPSAGNLLVAEVNPYTEHWEFGQRVGVMFAEDTLYKNRTPAGNLAFFARLRGLPRERVQAVLQSTGLADQANVRVDKLSSSLMRRLALAQGLLHDPQVLILEEPFARCDEPSISLISSLLREAADAQKTVLILANSADRLGELCDTLYTLENGRVAEVRRPKEEPAATLPFKIPVKLEDSVALINPAEILYAEAEGGRTMLFTADGPLPSQFTLAELETRLGRSGFFRTHRSYLVNLQHVREVITYTRSSFALKLSDANGSVIPLSKDAARELRDLLDY